jgi:hypothetical protein
MYKHRDMDHPGGGVAILVRSDVSHTNLDLQPYHLGNLEALGVNVILRNNAKLSILTLYNPNKVISSAELTHYIRQLEHSYCIVGDLNAHSPLWEPNKAPNSTGRNLVEVLIQDPTLALLTPPSLPTYHNVYQNSFSTLDLICISAH